MIPTETQIYQETKGRYKNLWFVKMKFIEEWRIVTMGCKTEKTAKQRRYHHLRELERIHFYVLQKQVMGKPWNQIIWS